MSQALALTAAIVNHGGFPGFAATIVTFTTEAYNTTNGATIDFSSLGLPGEWADYHPRPSQSDAGHGVIAYKTTAAAANLPDWQLRVMLFNGTTAITTGNITAGLRIRFDLGNRQI